MFGPHTKRFPGCAASRRSNGNRVQNKERRVVNVVRNRKELWVSDGGRSVCGWAAAWVRGRPGALVIQTAIGA